MDFDFLHLLLWLISLLLFAAVILSRPYLLLRPSVFVSALMIICINGAAVFANENTATIFSTIQKYNGTYNGFTQIHVFRYISIVFPLLVLAWCQFSPKITCYAKNLYAEGQQISWKSWKPKDSFVFCGLLLFWILILIWYFTQIPLNKTGIWAILFNPANAIQARQNSGTLLSSPFLKYAYSFLRAIIVPVLIITLWQKRLPLLLKIGASIIFMLSAMLPGQRAGIAVILIVCGIAYFLRNSFKRTGIVFILIISLCILTVFGTSVMRNLHRPNQFTAISMSQYTKSVIIDRLLTVPFMTGVLTLSYVENIHNGNLQGKNIRPVALLTGQKHISLPAQAWNYYFPDSPVKSGSMNTCFIFDFQAAFGLWYGAVLALFCLCMLDLILFIIPLSTSPIRIAFQASMYIGLLSMISSAFTTSLLSHGFLLCALGAALLGRQKSN